jgi:hypothetical protein
MNRIGVNLLLTNKTFLSLPHSISKRQDYFLLGEETLGEWLRPMSPELLKNIAHLI